MKILVTGGLGFIGSNLAKSLKAGNEIFIIDNLSSGNPFNYKINYDRMFSTYDNIPDVDCVYHLGMPSSSPMYKQDPSLLSNAVSDAVKLLEYAKKNRTPIVFASTSSLYNYNILPWNEFMPIHVTDYYTETRYYIERLFELYNKLYDIEYVGLRLFSVYGPGERSKGKYANLVTQFLLDMKKGKNPVLYYKGDQTRDFIYVDDVVECFKLAMGKLITHHPLPSVINVGTGRATSLNDLVKIINTKLGTDIKPAYLVPDNLPNYVESTQSDTGRMRACLYKNTPISLEDGVERLVEFYHGE